jgi:hypothetical protein
LANTYLVERPEAKAPSALTVVLQHLLNENSNWWCQGKKIAGIDGQVEYHWLRFIYRSQNYDGECQSHNYLVNLHSTSSKIMVGLDIGLYALHWVLAGEWQFYTAAKSFLVGIAIIWIFQAN